MRLQTSCTCSSTLGFARHERGGDHHRRKAISPAPRAALARHRKVPQIYCGFDQEPTCLRGHRHHCALHGHVIRGSTPSRAVTILTPSLATIILAIAIVSWPSTARVIRSQVLTVKERQFIERSRAIGARPSFIVRKHIIPNVMPLVWAEAVLTVSNSVFTEAFLSFFGLGASGPDVIRSWGVLVNESYIHLALVQGHWWYFGPPGLFITVVVLGFAMLGYGLEEVMNPALKRR